VLLKGLEPESFVFYTNFESDKGRQLLAIPRAALCFHWKSLRRQVRIRGAVSVVEGSEADAYFASRHPLSRIGAWASAQSRTYEDKSELVAAVERMRERFGEGDIPRPPHWSGFRLVPVQIEFWQDGPYRLHDRVRFRRDTPGGPWMKTYLYP
jgi:pyridoxamine 5'-phosphate oxidase